MKALQTLLAVAVLAVGCRPDFGTRSSRITEPRILAVKATPAEARPGEVVAYRALVAMADGAPALSWSTCATSKPATENNVVGASCLGKDVRAFGGRGPETSGEVPADACTLFGPDTPAPRPGEPPFRPHDADVTGGYYLPVRVDLPGSDPAVALERIRCNLVGASPEVARDFRERYVPNLAPHLLEVTAQVDGAPVALDALPAGATVTWRARWSGPEDVEPSAETYVVFDVVSQSLVERRESLRVSWYSTTGDFEADRTGRGEDETESFSENTWTAPTTPGPAQLWVVLRDARGGVDFLALNGAVVAR
ncbi:MULTISPECIES: hypothetical protein [Corallococcus]|uniref:hypothetical protein n=1 Tax=Corallococcus TaxID=83461 RepID=UPI00117CEB42|nr:MULTISPECIES: hypothetical protein [Corallococcus]NBD08763.1 hypothetical protein [Corallococcus silvisoli]TSC32721.1 hypothetical protein FOF48_06875 [Corallococcus sp. Z5C101001]